MEQHNYTPEIRELALKYQAALERMEIQHFKEIQSLKTQLETARKDNDILTGMVAAHYDTLKQYEAQLKTARTAGEAIDALLKEKNICPVVDDRENIKNLIYAETQPLRDKLDAARKALDRIRLHNDSYVSHRIATEALDLIGAGQKGGK